MKKQILELFYNENLSQKQIAEKLNMSKGFVSQVVTKDIRYAEYKQKKMQKNKKKHNKEIQKRVEEKRKQLQYRNSVDDLILKTMHDQASIELSKRNHLSDENYRKWNSSAYKYNPSKKRYEFDENLGRSYDVPKYIKER